MEPYNLSNGMSDNMILSLNSRTKNNRSFYCPRDKRITKKNLEAISGLAIRNITSSININLGAKSQKRKEKGETNFGMLA